MGNWICPRHLRMAPPPEPSTEKTITAPLLDVRWGYLSKSISWFSAVGWGRAGREGVTGTLEQSQQDGAKRWGEALRCVEDTFGRQSADLSSVPEMLGVVSGCASEPTGLPFICWGGKGMVWGRTTQETACVSVRYVRIPWTEEPGGLYIIHRSQTIGHDGAT